MRPAILASGGMDSFLVWAKLGGQALNVFVDIGHKYADKERTALQHLQERVPGFEVVYLKGPPLGHNELPSGIIPLRNAYLVLQAATFSDTIHMGVLKDEINSDKSEDFERAIEVLLNVSWRGQYWNDGVARTFNVTSPIRHLTKTEAVREYLDGGNSVDHLLETISCYDAHEGHCGACPSCFKRWVALTNNDLPTTFRTNPARWGMDTGLLHKAMNGTYKKDRANEILSAYAKVGYS